MLSRPHSASVPLIASPPQAGDLVQGRERIRYCRIPRAVAAGDRLRVRAQPGRLGRKRPVERIEGCAGRTASTAAATRRALRRPGAGRFLGRPDARIKRPPTRAAAVGPRQKSGLYRVEHRVQGRIHRRRSPGHRRRHAAVADGIDRRLRERAVAAAARFGPGHRRHRRQFQRLGVGQTQCRGPGGAGDRADRPADQRARPDPAAIVLDRRVRALGILKDGVARALRTLRAATSSEPAERVVRLLSAQMMRLRFTAAARAASVESRVTAHSGRIGLDSELTTRGTSTTDVMLAGNWKTSRMVAHYSAGATAERGAVARYL